MELLEIILKAPRSQNWGSGGLQSLVAEVPDVKLVEGSQKWAVVCQLPLALAAGGRHWQQGLGLLGGTGGWSSKGLLVEKANQMRGLAPRSLTEWI